MIIYIYYYKLLTLILISKYYLETIKHFFNLIYLSKIFIFFGNVGGVTQALFRL